MTTPAKNSKTQYLMGALTFLGCYVVMLFVVFLMMVISDPSGWMTYMVDNYSKVLSLIVSIFFLFSVVYFYYFFEDPASLTKTNSILLIFTMLIVSVIVSYAFGEFIHIYFRPVAVFALLALFLTSRREALFLNFIFSFVMFVIDLFTNTIPGTDINSEVYSSFLLSFIGGTLAVFLAGKVKTRGGLLLTGVFVALPTALVVLLFNIPTVTHNWIDYVSAVGFRTMSCIVSAILALAFMPFFEWAFNRLTVFRLRELTSTDAALLVRLKTEAPGTFNHSLIVAQLAESCAVAIGENAELARTAAYYHDVGKLKEPTNFTENLNPGEYDVHVDITPELSADIIRSHAQNGYDLLIANRLPKIIADVAREHHGTLPIKYFYDKAIRYSGDADLKDFSYRGPIPQSKIAAIIMIADAAEAATRAMADRTPEKVEAVCRTIIEERMDLGQFEECDITMRELTVIRSTLVDTLSGVHHHRVQYPAIQFGRDRQVFKKEEPDE